MQKKPILNLGKHKKIEIQKIMSKNDTKPKKTLSNEIKNRRLKSE